MRKFHFPTTDASPYPYNVWSAGNHTVLENWMKKNISGDCRRRYPTYLECGEADGIKNGFNPGLEYSFENETDAVFFQLVWGGAKFKDYNKYDIAI